jgi:predicted nucleic acid-binding protein
MIVLDPSAIAPLALAEEDQAAIKKLLTSIMREGALVPQLFWFEFRAMLITAERSRRITEQVTAEVTGRLQRMWLEVDDEPEESAVFALARKHDLTFYDAAYLELAARTGATLASLDKALRKAAVDIGVPITPKWTR